MQQSGRIAGHGIYWSVLLIFVVLFVGRLLGVYNIYFLEEDEISLAAGIAGLVRDNVGDLYRYTPQLGYHRIVEWMTLATGGDVSRVPWLMKLWSVTVGALVPALGFLLFRDQLSTLERWLLVLSLATNPILWRSSQYGNSAMGSLGFAVLAMVFLSNRGGSGTRALGLAFAGTAIFVRADAVLLVPMFAYLLFRQLGSWRPTLGWLAGFAVVGALTATIIYAADTRLDDVASAVAAHMTVRNRTQFWEYLLWAMSPIPLFFAVLGARVLADTRPALLGAVVLGCLGPMLFYFRATTTPRYFLLTTVPMATAVAVGMSDAAGYLRERWGGRLAWAAVLAAGCLHLFVGMGQFPADRLRSIVDDANISTHDGPMPTGSFLYQTYLRGGFLGQSFGNSGFGSAEADNWEARTYPLVFEELKRRRTPQNVIFLLASGWDHVFHFYAQAEHADYLSRQPSNPSWPFSSETWIKVGLVSVMTIGYRGDDYKALPRFDVEKGDEVWITGSLEFPDDEARFKVPAGLTLTATDSFDPRLRVFRVEAHDD